MHYSQNYSQDNCQNNPLVLEIMLASFYRVHQRNLLPFNISLLQQAKIKFLAIYRRPKEWLYIMAGSI